MIIDWSTMTKEKYCDLLEFNELIKKDKCKIALLLVEAKSHDNNEFIDIIKDLENLLIEYDEINKIMEEYLL